MNNIFDLQRLSLLIRKQWVENNRTYLFSWLTLAGVLACFFLLTVRGIDDKFQRIMLVMSFLISISIFSSMMFADLADKTKGILYLTVPASHLEKLLCNLFYTIAFFIPVYFLTFFLIDFIFVSIHNGMEHVVQTEVINPIHKMNMPGVLAIFFFNIQALFSLGSVYFGKNAYIKTAGFLFVLTIILLFSNFTILDKLISDKNNIVGRSIGFSINLNDDEIIETPLKNFIRIVRFVGTYLTTPFFWLVTFFRIKEKQI